MNIDWNVFNPWSALLGGVVIGLAWALCVRGNGRVAGIAGTVGGPLRTWLSGGWLAPEAPQQRAVRAAR